MRSGAVASLFAFLALFAGQAVADRPVVIELFTSQGCSSCPPADALLGELAERDDVLPLALHVDYWDYIGWKDEFADPGHAERQRGYSRAAGMRTIYTPQMVVSGQDHVVGYKPMKVADLIAKHREVPAVAIVDATRTGDAVSVSVAPSGDGPGQSFVVLVTYQPKETVAIRRGENAGRTYTYHNIVSDMAVLGLWDGQSTFDKTVNVPADGSYAVIVQTGEAGAIIAAARVD